MLLKWIFGLLAGLSLCLTLWQWIVALRFPLHQRAKPLLRFPGLTLLKPLKGCDSSTEQCLRSWLMQKYAGAVQVLFAVASDKDPVCLIVEKLLKEFPLVDGQLVVCGQLEGTNLKVSKLVQLEPMAKHEFLVISDADVNVPEDFLANVVAPLEDAQIGLVNCFYKLANPATLAMDWEAVGMNADFWSQVLQSQSLKPLDFALGAVMATRKQQLEEIGGFASLADCLADDYQLGKRIAAKGFRIVLSSIVVECWSEPMGWRAAWKHQVRWARTIRVCQPVPYFFSILSNATLWPVLLACFNFGRSGLLFASACLLVRVFTALDLQRRLTQKTVPLGYAGMVLLKDMLQTAIWLLAFLGNRVEWRGEKMRLRSDGTLSRN